jgi:1-deoxy-D-xylulose-5-phosphate reductoisomerase
MGARITVASATLANKALEVIEAHYLFETAYRDIMVVVHPQSVVHSMVEFVDGSVMAQMGFPTMELPILYALTHPDRVSDAELRNFDPVRSSPLTFERVDDQAFPLFGIGVRAGREGGTAPTVFNAANEIAVGAFLDERLPFQGMSDVVAETLIRVPSLPVRELGDVLEADRAAREVAGNLVDHQLPAVPGSDA